MIKTKKKNIHLPLVITGYTMFALLLLGTLISTTVPFGILLFNPKVLHLNVAVTLIALTIGALLPVLAGYFIGDHSIKTKSKLNHHFTGVLFGLLAYWIMILPVVFIPLPPEFTDGNRNVSLLINSIFPSICVAVITTIISVSHVRSRHAKQEILAYKPFSVFLITLIIALPLSSLVQNIVTNSVSIYSFTPFVLLVIAGVVSYITLRKTKLTIYQKIVWSAVSVSVLYVAMYVSIQFISTVFSYLIPRPTMETQTLESWLCFVAALIGWAAYWAVQVKTLRQSNR